MEESISLERAVELITGSAAPLGSEEITPSDSLGRVLARDVFAPIDQPPFPRSPLDGYAFRAADSAGASQDTPAVLTVVDTVFAGGWCGKTVGPGQAVRIMTGAPIPQGCDCVIRQEDTNQGVERVEIYQSLRPFENYCHRGEDFKRGEILLSAGAVLDGTALGVLASAGLFRDDVELSVRRVPRAALLCTGDELAENHVRPLPPGKIYSSNRTCLWGRLTALGIPVASAPTGCADEPEEIAAALRELAEVADVIITTGGVSVGARDAFHQALPLLGAERLFWRVRCKPGTPAMYAVCRGKPILCLSGNPFAASATFELLGRPLLAALAGRPSLCPLKAVGTLETDFPKGGGMRRFVRGCFREGRVALPQGHSPGQLRSAVGTNCLVELNGPAQAGERVTVYIL